MPRSDPLHRPPAASCQEGICTQLCGSWRHILSHCVKQKAFRRILFDCSCDKQRKSRGGTSILLPRLFLFVFQYTRSFGSFQSSCTEHAPELYGHCSADNKKSRPGKRICSRGGIRLFYGEFNLYIVEFYSNSVSSISY